MKLTLDHSSKIKNLFNKTDEVSSPFDIKAVGFSNVEHEIFHNNYLGQLKNWHSFADDQVSTAIVFYQSEDEASWYITDTFGSGDMQSLISEAIEFNQKYNLFKFYLTIPVDTAESFSLNNHEYDYFDEMIVQKKTRCHFSTIWQLLYHRTLPTNDTLVRCYYLKREYRKTINIGGSL
jgi:hypothetical protein